MCPFSVAMEGVGFFIGSTVRLGHVEKWPFLVACSKVLRTGLNIVEWYHFAIYVLLLAARALSAADCCCLGRWYGLLVRLTFYMPDVLGQVPYNTVRPYFTILR